MNAIQQISSALGAASHIALFIQNKMLGTKHYWAPFCYQGVTGKLCSGSGHLTLMLESPVLIQQECDALQEALPMFSFTLLKEAINISSKSAIVINELPNDLSCSYPAHNEFQRIQVKCESFQLLEAQLSENYGALKIERERLPSLNSFKVWDILDEAYKQGEDNQKINASILAALIECQLPDFKKRWFQPFAESKRRTTVEKIVINTLAEMYKKCTRAT